MTCVACVKKDGVIVIGADSLFSRGTGWSSVIGGQSKVFKNGKIVFGVCGTPRVNQLLQYSLNIPYHKEGISDYKYLCTDFIRAVRDCFEYGGLKQKEAGRIERFAGDGTCFMVLYKGSIYVVYSDYQIMRIDVPFWAIGCGETFAIGSIHVMYRGNLKPRTIVKKALDIASHYDPGVKGPYNFITVRIN